MKIVYKDYEIVHDPPPIPIRTHDWQFYHRDYDGPGDARCGTAESEDACCKAIDELETE